MLALQRLVLCSRNSQGLNEFGSCLASHCPFPGSTWETCCNNLMCQSSKGLSLLLLLQRWWANSFTAMPHPLLCIKFKTTKSGLKQSWGCCLFDFVQNICKMCGALNFLDRCSKRCPSQVFAEWFPPWWIGRKQFNLHLNLMPCILGGLGHVGF